MIQDHNGDGIKTRCGCVLGTARPPDRDLYNAVLQHYIIVITLRAKLSGAVYCNRSCLWVGLWLYFFVAVSVTTITRNCVHRSSSNWVYR